MTTTAKKPAVRRRGGYGVVVVSSVVGAATGMASAGVGRARVAGQPVGVWLLVVLGAVAFTAMLDWAARWVRARWGPARGGWAGGAEVDAELSGRALRRIGTWTRPSLTTAAGRRAVPPGELGYTAHRWCGRRLWVPWEGSAAVLAPRGDGARVMVPVALAAPGALLVAGATADLAAAIIQAREHRGGVGPTRVVGSIAVDGAQRLRWPLVAGCHDPVVARRRAAAMITATPTSPALCPPGSALDDTTADRRARTLATTLLADYLVAAARTSGGLDALVDWITARSPEPAQLLTTTTDRATPTGMLASCAPVDRERAWRHVEAAINPLQDPTTRRHWAGTGDTLPGLVATAATVILAPAPASAPLVNAVATAWIDAAAHTASTAPAGRVDPPAVAVLNDLAELTPIPDLPATISAWAQQGVLVHWSAQSLTDLTARYGSHASDLLAATTTVDVRAGLTDPALLGWVVWRATHTTGTEPPPGCTVADLHRIRTGRAVVLHRSLPPLRTRPIRAARGTHDSTRQVRPCRR